MLENLGNLVLLYDACFYFIVCKGEKGFEGLTSSSKDEMSEEITFFSLTG